MRSFRAAALLALPLVAVPAVHAAARAAPRTTPAIDQAADPAALNDVKQGVDAWERGDYGHAVAIWRPLALDGDPDAQFDLGQAYKLGRGVPADLIQAEDWYRRAAKQGHLQAEDNLGLVLFTANRHDEAMPYITRSAERGEPRAQYVLGTALFNGDLAPRDWPRAYALTKRASDAGLDIASARLAQLDRLIPLEQRQRGLAMLPELERGEQRAHLAAVNAAAPLPAAPQPSPIKAASLPPSVPGTSYAAPPLTAAAQPAKAAPAAVVKVHAAPASPWRAQLGAFSADANARKLWAALARKYPAVAVRQPVFVKAGNLTRLQARGFAGKGDADSFCATMKKGGQTCLVVDR